MNAGKTVRGWLLVLGLAMSSTWGAVPKLLWQQFLPGYADKPTVADLNGDGRLEVVACTDQGKVVAVGGSNGAILWTYAKDKESYLSCPLVGDVDGDGTVEILVTGFSRGYVTCLNGEDGTPQWEVEPEGVGLTGTTALADTDGDGVQELIYANRTAVRALNASTGAVLWEEQLTAKTRGSVSVGDIDGNKLLNTLVGVEDGRLVCIGAGGGIKWAAALRGLITKPPLLDDAEHDGKLEAYVVARTLARVDGRGKIVWEWAPKTGRGTASALAAGDLDGDGKDDLVAAGYDGNLYALNAKGKLLWSYTVAPPDENGKVVYIPSSTPALADVDGDGRMDAIMASPRSDAPQIFAVSGRSGTRLWSIPVESYSQCCPAVADLNRDGKPEIIVADAAGRLYAYSLNSEAKVAWPKYNGGLACRGDAARAAYDGKYLAVGELPLVTRPLLVAWADKLEQPAPDIAAPGAAAPFARPLSDIAVSLNGQWLDLDPAPVNLKGSVLVPLRGIFEAMQAEVKYDPKTRTITATRGDTKVVLKLGSRDATINGRPAQLRTPAQLIGASTYVPLRFIGEAFGAAVTWNAAEKNVEIAT